MKARVFINKPEYYDKIIEKLIEDDLKTKDYKHINDRIMHDFGGHIILVNQMDDKNPELTIFRITDYIPPKGEEHLIKHYSYNPIPGLGRANIPGYPVFYGSFSPGTCISEMKVLENCPYYISKWKLIPKDGLNIATLIMGIEKEEEFSSTIMSKSTEKAFNQMLFDSEEHRNWFKHKHKRFCDLFTFKDSSAYHLTSAIAHNYLYDSLQQGADIPIIAYPSITNDFKDVNLAIRADLADNSDIFYMENIIKCELIEKIDQGYTIKVSEKGFIEDDEIKWYSLFRQFIRIDPSTIAIKPQCHENFNVYPKDQEILAECGSYSGDLREFIIEQYSIAIAGVIEEQFEEEMGKIDFLNESFTYPISRMIIVDISPGLYYEVSDGRHQVEKIAMKVDFQYNFLPNNLN